MASRSRLPKRSRNTSRVTRTPFVTVKKIIEAYCDSNSWIDACAKAEVPDLKWNVVLTHKVLSYRRLYKGQKCRIKVELYDATNHNPKDSKKPIVDFQLYEDAISDEEWEETEDWLAITTLDFFEATLRACYKKDFLAWGREREVISL